jgi:CheY-like chemotaxis protein
MATIQTVLIVEDCAEIAMLEADLIRASDRQVIVVSDGVAALAILASTQIDLILLDLNLPKLSGQDVLEQLTTRPTLNQIPVLVVSGNLTSVRPTPQVVGLIEKPFDSAQLAAAIQGVEQLNRDAPCHDLPWWWAEQGSH